MNETYTMDQEVREFRDEGADEQLVLTEEFVREGETIERETRIAKLDDGGLSIVQSDQTFEQVYLGLPARAALRCYLIGQP